jgi:hypothetical protein
MALNGSSIRDTARVLKVSPTSNYSPPLAFGIQRFYTNAWGAYQRLLKSQEHIVGIGLFINRYEFGRAV